jgi:group I intron endonuclease
MDEVLCGVYKVTSPVGKVYVGSSKNIARRFEDYKKLSCSKQIKLYNSLKKYGSKTHEFDILELCEDVNLYTRERYWQEYYNVLDRSEGLNCKYVQTDESRVVYSDETRDKVIKSLKAYNSALIDYKYQYDTDGNLVRVWKNWSEIREFSNYTASYIRYCIKGKFLTAYGFLWANEVTTYSTDVLEMAKLTKSDKLKGHTFNRGRKLSPEHIERLRITSTGKKHNKESKDKISSSKFLPVEQYTLEGKYIATYKSAKEAAESLGIGAQGISSCRTGRYCSYKGYIWKYQKTEINEK